MVDVTVRGAGILGLCTAWVCTQRGAHVRIIDPNGAGAGSSGGILGALAPHVPENWNPKKAFQLESLLMAKSFWTQIEQASGVSAGYAQTGRIQPIEDIRALELAKGRETSAKTLWQDQANWHVEKAPAHSWCPISPSGWVIRDTLSAHLYPRQACDALVTALGRRGVEITTTGHDAGAVLWATGVAGLETLSAARPRIVGNGVKGQAALLDYNAIGAPQIFVDGVHIIPHMNGTVAVGSTSEREYDHPTSTDAQLENVIAKASAGLPALRDARVIDRWAGVRPRARSRAPMLGAWPGRMGHFIANGGFKIGFGMAPKIAHVMADLMLEGRDAIPDGFEVAASF